MLNIQLHSDYPPNKATTQIEGTTTFSDLQKHAAKALGLEVSVAEKYLFLNVAYGHDVIELGVGGGSKTLSDAGVKDKSHIFLRAPADIRPALRRRPKNEGKEKKGDEADDDRFAGFTTGNAFGKLSVAKGGKPRAIALEYIDIYLSKLIKHPTFLTLPIDTLVEITKRDTISCPEGELLSGCMAWAKSECKKKDLEASPQNLKTEMKSILPNIRFPIMETQDVATTVASSGLLDGTQLVELFTYVGIRSKLPDAPLGNSLKEFSAKARKPRRPPSWFKFDVNRKFNDIQVSEDGTEVRLDVTSGYSPCGGDIELSKGVHEWEIVLERYTSSTYAVQVGVVPASYSAWTSGHMIGYPGHMQGWSFNCGNGQKMNNSNAAYTSACVQGDVIKVKLDCDAQSIEFFVNGTSKGVAFQNVSGAVRPAVSLYGINTVKLRFPQ